MGSTRKFSLSQLMIRVKEKSYRYYDGIQFSADGEPLKKLKPFQARRIIKEDVAELNKDITTSGFKDMFPILWGALDVNAPVTTYVSPSHTRLFISDEHHAAHWRDIVATCSLTTEWVQSNTNHNSMNRVNTRKPKAKAWNDLMKAMKQHMYENVDTETFIL
jgi:hypothetical protein